MSRLLTTCEAARALGLSDARVKQLDHLLAPVRVGRGWRLFDPDRVRAVADARAWGALT